jgi:putative acyl-CoA dehydrogenase
LQAARGRNGHFDAFIDALKTLLQRPEEADGRHAAHAIALAAQAALLTEHAPTEVADAFCATRLCRDTGWGASFGTLPGNTAVRAILERAAPR